MYYTGLPSNTVMWHVKLLKVKCADQATQLIGLIVGLLTGQTKLK